MDNCFINRGALKQDIVELLQEHHEMEEQEANRLVDDDFIESVIDEIYTAEVEAINNALFNLELDKRLETIPDLF